MNIFLEKIKVDKDKMTHVEKILKQSNIHFDNLGITQKDDFEIEGEYKKNVKELYKLNNKWYYNYYGITN